MHNSYYECIFYCPVYLTSFCYWAVRTVRHDPSCSRLAWEEYLLKQWQAVCVVTRSVLHSKTGFIDMPPELDKYRTDRTGPDLGPTRDVTQILKFLLSLGLRRAQTTYISQGSTVADGEDTFDPSWMKAVALVIVTQMRPF